MQDCPFYSNVQSSNAARSQESDLRIECQHGCLGKSLWKCEGQVAASSEESAVQFLASHGSRVGLLVQMFSHAPNWKKHWTHTVLYNNFQPGIGSRSRSGAGFDLNLIGCSSSRSVYWNLNSARETMSTAAADRFKVPQVHPTVSQNHKLFHRRQREEP